MCPDTEMSGDILEIHTFILTNSTSDAKYHVGIIRPITFYPSLTVSVLENLIIMLDTVRIFPCHILICHTFCSQAKSVSNSLTIDDAFKPI